MFLIKKNFFCIFIFSLVLASSNLYAETFFLINPSVQCKGHLENSFKKYLYKEKDLFIFPAWLKHYVAPFKSDVERISVSGNIASNVPFSAIKKKL